MTDWATKAYQAIIDSGIDWADKNAAAGLLEDSKASVLAVIANSIDEKSATAKESRARATPEFGDFLVKLRDARKERDTARVRYEAARTLASLRQTQESLKKAEMNLK